jgi:hypothetical protein
MKHCHHCDFTVKTNWELNRHNETIKHKKNMELYMFYFNKIKLHCQVCDKRFNDENEKLLHDDECNKKNENIIIERQQNEITELKNEILTLNNKIITQQNEISTLNNEIITANKKLEKINNENFKNTEKINKDHSKEIKKLNKEHLTHIEELTKELTKEYTEHVEELYKTSNKTLETITKLAIKEIRQKYPDAPLLERMNNEIVNQIMNDVFRKGDNDYKMCSRILFLYKDKQLVNLISDAILSYYKKLDPKDQAFWNTDTARLNYIIKDTVDDKESWVIDKFGVKMKNLVIAPLGDELRNYIFEHKNVLCKNSLDRNNNSFMIQKLQEEINICFDIMFFVDEKKFEYNICKTMAPKMYYNNNVSTKAIENG